MNKRIAIAGVVLLTWSVAFPSSESADAQEKGSIKGTISARGVRTPENVLVYVEKVPGEHKPPEKQPTQTQPTGLAPQ